MKKRRVAFAWVGALLLVAAACGGGGGTSPEDGGASQLDSGSGGGDAATSPDASLDSGTPVATDATSDTGTVGPLDSAAPGDTSAPQDSGAEGDDAPFDASGSSLDAADGALDGGASDGAPSLLVGGAGFHIFAVTSDGYVVYWGPTAPGASTNSIFAVPIAGGSATAIAGPYTGYFYVSVLGPDVFVWNQLGTSSLGSLVLWTHGAGLVTLSESSLTGDAWTNNDGSVVGFVTNVTASQKDFAIARTDGSGATSLTAGAYRAACPFWAAFVSGGVVTQHCDLPLPDGGADESVPPTLTFYPTSGAPVDLLTLPPDPELVEWRTDNAGDLLYAPTNATNAGVVFSFPSGTKTTIDPSGASTGNLYGDGSNVVYATTTGAIRISPTASPSPTTLVPSGAAGLAGLSPDNGTIAFFSTSTVDSSGDLLTDLSVAPTNSPSDGVSVVDIAALLAPAYTSDSSWIATYITTSTDDVTGSLSACPVGLDAGGAAAAEQLGTNVTGVWIATGAKVVFQANYSVAAEVADVYSADLNAGGTPVLIAESAYNFALSADLTQIAFATGVGTPGVFVTQVP